MKQLFVVFVAALLLAGCVNISDSAKAAGFGKNAKEKKALDFFTKKYGDPNGPGAPRILEALMATSVTDFMPADKVLKYNKEAAAFNVWFFYDNFGTSDTITVEFKYLDEGTSIHTFTAKGGGDYGAATFALQKPDEGWPTGSYEVLISGKGVSETVKFEVIDGPTVAEALPYDAGTGAAAPAAAEPAASSKSPATASMTTDTVAFDTTPGYIGACSLTDKSAFKLENPIQASLLQVWYNWGSGESVITYTLTKDGSDFMSGSMVRADCDPYQGNWCNGNQKISKEFPAGNYVLSLTSKKMCLQPGKTGTVRIYGKTAAAAATACSIIGDWKWFNHEHVYLRTDGTLDAWDSGAKTEWGTWKKNTDGSYTLNWNKGYVDDLVLSSGCKSLSGKNQYDGGVSGNKLSDTVSALPSAALPAGVPAHLGNCNYAGNWNTDWGSMVLKQEGTKVTGTYTWDSGKVAGTLVDGVFVGKWSESPSYSEPGDGGDMVFYFTKDCNGFTGNWHYGVHTSGGWSGTWVGTKAS